MCSKAKMKMCDQAISLILKHGSEILLSDKMQANKNFIQHGEVTLYNHCVFVACVAVYLVIKFKIKRVDMKSLVRASLLHDYFQYDWHDSSDGSHRLHGFHHARRALINAERDYKLNKIEINAIDAHMFPLNMRLPKYRESVLVTLSDKLVAFKDTFHIKDSLLERAASRLDIKNDPGEPGSNE